MNLFSWYWSFSVVVAVLYTALMVWFLNGWKSIPYFKSQKNIFLTKVSVIVPFYNEQASLKKCIEGLLKQHIQTTEFEILLVDDQSDDESVSIAKKFAENNDRIRYLRTFQKGKKQAILLGAKEALGDLIVTTDADCKYNENWLATIVDYYEQYKPNMIVGPLMLERTKGLFSKFQELEFASLVTTGAGAVGIGHAIMCNGANLAYKKEVFESFDDPLNLKYTSGDDVFLLHNMKILDNDKIHFVKSQEAMVQTRSSKGFKEFLKQRKRWVSKAPGYKDNDTKFTAFVVFAASVLWFIGFALMGLNVEFWKPALFLFLVKSVVDLLLLYQVSDFFKISRLLKWIPVFQLFYGVYVLTSGMSLMFGSKTDNQRIN